MAASKAEAVSRLRVALQDGYVLVDRRGLHKTPRIPRSWEPGFNDGDNNFSRALQQQSVNGDFQVWEVKLSEAFEDCGLSWERFRLKTENVDEAEGYSEAFMLKRKIDELDKIVNSSDVMKSYMLLTGNLPAIFKDDTVTQGNNRHRFTETQVIGMLNLLWPSRRIVNTRGDELKPCGEYKLSELMAQLKMSKLRFEAVTKNISAARTRDEIKIWVRNPRGTDNVFIQVLQDRL